MRSGRAAPGARGTVRVGVHRENGNGAVSDRGGRAGSGAGCKLSASRAAASRIVCAQKRASRTNENKQRIHGSRHALLRDVGRVT